MYGLTEAFRVSILPPDKLEQKWGSIGKPIPNTDIFIIDENVGLCKNGEVGELILRGSLISKGYWKNKEETDKKIKTNKYLFDIIGEEKVLHTGDYVRMDPDGFLFFVGREDELIKSQGYRISPSEIENIIYKNFKVDGAVVFGISDLDMGQAIVLVIYKPMGNIESISIKKTFREQTPFYMRPSKIIIIEENCPRNTNGKIDRKKIKQLFKEKLTKEIARKAK